MLCQDRGNYGIEYYKVVNCDHNPRWPLSKSIRGGVSAHLGLLFQARFSTGAGPSAEGPGKGARAGACRLCKKMAARRGLVYLYFARDAAVDFATLPAMEYPSGPMLKIRGVAIELMIRAYPTRLALCLDLCCCHVHARILV